MSNIIRLFRDYLTVRRRGIFRYIEPVNDASLTVHAHIPPLFRPTLPPATPPGPCHLFALLERPHPRYGPSVAAGGMGMAAGTAKDKGAPVTLHQTPSHA